MRKEEVVLITGGTTGIGLAAARRFLSAGAKVVIAGRRKAQGQQALDILRPISPDVHFVAADVSDPGQARALVDETVRLFSRLTIAFNNAGIEGRFTSIDDMTDTEFAEVIDINLKGVWLCCKYEVAQFRRQGGGGVIVNTSSWLAEGAFAGSAAYSASKAALDAMTRVLAIETAPDHIRINTIRPGYVQTPMFDRFFPGEEAEVRKAPLIKHVPAGRFATPDDVAEAVGWLCSPSAAYITGESIRIDGGLAISGQRG